jgi:hypothetical protein
MNCPTCYALISEENINIQADIAKCSKCHTVFKISENISPRPHDVFNMETPPNGAWIKRNYNGLNIGASTRSPIAFFLVPFMIVWSGVALGGIYGTQILNGEFNLLMSLFGIPFIIGAVTFWSLAFMFIAGKVELDINDEGGRIFTGIGKLGFYKSFSWDEVNSVKEKPVVFRSSGSSGNSLMFEGKRRIVFGFGLNESRRYYLLRSLQVMLANKHMNKRIF